MNIKTITFSTLFLFFIVITRAQTSSFSTDNIVDVSIVVKDFSSTREVNQKFNLDAPTNQETNQNSRISLRINLEYKSDLDRTSYFRLFYTIKSQTNGFVIIHQGITVPVIIPPIKKDSVAASLESYHANNYPHIITTNYTPSETNYMVQIDLVKYDNEHDYINDFDNYTTGPSLTIHLTTSTNSSFSPEDSTDSFSVTTHPNPSTNHIVFEYPNTSDRNSISKQLPLDVIIFNNKGVKMNQYSLTSTSSKTNNISYNLNISHLQKGRYYFQLSREGKTQVKIIQKE